jgi:hypothetical protein
MIISHKHKFIFIKTNKTAGTSIEIALSKICGSRDVITPISPEDEALRKKLGYRGPQNCLGLNGIEFVNHLTAARIKEGVEQKIWNEYYKFCFQRNPWDRIISLYYWRNKREPRISISKFLETDFPLLLIKRGHDLYSIDGEIVVDKICLFENIAEELEQVLLHLGIGEKIVLPRAKSGYRKDNRHYRDILSASEKEKIAKIFHRDIENFGYIF